MLKDSNSDEGSCLDTQVIIYKHTCNTLQHRIWVKSERTYDPAYGLGGWSHLKINKDVEFYCDQ